MAGAKPLKLGVKITAMRKHTLCAQLPSGGWKSSSSTYFLLKYVILDVATGSEIPL